MKKILSTVLTISLILSLSTTAFAAESTESKMINPEGLKIEFVEKDELEIKTLPEMNIEKLVKSGGLHSVQTINEYPITDLAKGTELENDLINKPSAIASKSASAVTQSWTGTLANQGDFTYVFATLAPNQILNATLVCPQNANLNYDLLVYEVDSAGTLTNLVAGSTTQTYMNTYPDGTVKTVDEGAGYVNKGTQTQQYAVIVSAVQGGSTTDAFELTLSLDSQGAYDAAEPSDSAYAAYSIKGGISGANLHVVNDQDWYIWESPSDIRGAEITVDQGHKVEVYNVVGGNQLVLADVKSENQFDVTGGINYIRVYTDNANFSSNSYALNIKVSDVVADRISVYFNGDMGDSLISYPQGNYFRFKDYFSAKVTVISPSGYAVPNYPVKLQWGSGSWNEHTGNKYRSDSGYTDANGEVVLEISPPTSLGENSYYLSGAINFNHYYDIDAVLITAPRVDSYSTPVYHFAYSNYVSS